MPSVENPKKISSESLKLVIDGKDIFQPENKELYDAFIEYSKSPTGKFFESFEFLNQLRNLNELEIDSPEYKALLEKIYQDFIEPTATAATAFSFSDSSLEINISADLKAELIQNHDAGKLQLTDLIAPLKEIRKMLNGNINAFVLLKKKEWAEQDRFRFQQVTRYFMDLRNDKAIPRTESELKMLDDISDETYSIFQEMTECIRDPGKYFDKKQIMIEKMTALCNEKEISMEFREILLENMGYLGLKKDMHVALKKELSDKGLLPKKNISPVHSKTDRKEIEKENVNFFKRRVEFLFSDENINKFKQKNKDPKKIILSILGMIKELNEPKPPAGTESFFISKVNDVFEKLVKVKAVDLGFLIKTLKNSQKDKNSPPQIEALIKNTENMQYSLSEFKKRILEIKEEKGVDIIKLATAEIKKFLKCRDYTDNKDEGDKQIQKCIKDINIILRKKGSSEVFSLKSYTIDVGARHPAVRTLPSQSATPVEAREREYAPLKKAMTVPNLNAVPSVQKSSKGQGSTMSITSSRLPDPIKKGP